MSNSVSGHFQKFAVLHEAAEAGKRRAAELAARAEWDASGVEKASGDAGGSVVGDGAKGVEAAGVVAGGGAAGVGPVARTEGAPAGAEGTKMKVGRDFKFEEATAEQKDHLLLAWEVMTQGELVQELAKNGVRTSVPTVSRYLRRWEAEKALQESDDLKGAAEGFAARGEGSAMRAGSLEAARAKFFERVVGCKDPKEGLRLYETLVAEEEGLKRLALEEKKTEMQARRLELQAERLRLQLDAGRGGGAGARLGVGERQLFLEALRILRDEAMEDRAKIALAVERLQGWKEEAIEVGVKMIAREV